MIVTCRMKSPSLEKKCCSGSAAVQLGNLTAFQVAVVARRHHVTWGRIYLRCSRCFMVSPATCSGISIVTLPALAVVCCAQPKHRDSNPLSIDLKRLYLESFYEDFAP